MSQGLVVIHEHPEWQKPLFAALERLGVPFGVFDLKAAAFDPGAVPAAKLYFNQASPSAYVRGNTRAVPLCLSLLRALETGGARVLNGSSAFSLELSKSTQAALLKKIGIDHPRTLTFNDPETALRHWDAGWPALLKPEQGGSGARMFLLNEPDELPRLLREQPQLWQPDNLLLLQEYFAADPAQGIVRTEWLGGEMLYAMRVISNGAFNLCPSEVCNPGDGSGGHCEIPTMKPTKPVEFHAYPDIPPAAIAEARRVAQAAGLDVGGIEYLETAGGRRIFYDINANSNLRAPVAQEFGGFDPFDRVAAYLKAELDKLA